ncbi:hypothetical protein CARUB_v10003521mg [Capsella rubella]|uniref:Uncharacterized protein n=1 Tax=Capsella rubella TaxID=81985 RepID=R0HG78_9BRAS|nr:hypothetical protein CARUB_v10003521mg [Capsella rubella]
MEVIKTFGPQLPLRARINLSPVRKHTPFLLTSKSLKLPKKVLLKATATSAFDGRESNRTFKKLPPSEWTSHFLSVSVDNSEMDVLRREIEALKPKVRGMLLSSQGREAKKKRILLIYQLVSLGLAWHFEDEIKESLEESFKSIADMMVGEYDLYNVSIIFWVFRTYGHNMSSDVFKRFQGDDGKFKEHLIEDIKGILALYEAANMGTKTDYVMDEAISFATTHLESFSIGKMCSSHFKTRIQNALGISQYHNMEIIVAKEYIPFYEHEDDHDITLLKLSKLKFNLLQLHYTQELKIVTEYVISSVIILFNFYVHYTCLNNHTKNDDHDDDKIDRCLCSWSPDDVNAIYNLPSYLKVVCKIIYDAFEEFEKEMVREGRLYCLKETIEEFKRLVKSNHDLAKWALESHIPSFDEYMEVGEVEITVYAVLTMAFMCMGDVVEEEAYQWLKSRPKLIESSCSKARLLNDIAGFEDDMSRGYVTNGIKCYMKQYGVTEEEAIRELRKIISDMDKTMKEEFLNTKNVKPFRVLKSVIDCARMSNVTYNVAVGEGLTHPEGKISSYYMPSLFLNRFSL